MSYAPAPVVDDIARQPLPYGLFSVLTPRPDTTDGKWENGIKWETLGCEPASGIGDPQCDPEDTTGLPKNLGGGNGELGEATPFTVYASYTCSPVGHTVEYAQERANGRLLAREEARAEQAIWTGDLDNEGFAPDATNVGGAASPIAVAIGELENWIGREYGSLGVIHMTRQAALVGLAELALVITSRGLFTALGTPVIAGAGYPGTGPAGQSPADGQSYIYATPALVGYRGEPFPGASPTSAGLNRAVNDLHAVAERTYVVGWDPCGTAYSIATLG